MLALTNAEFLALWERGRGLHPIDQGVLAIEAAHPAAEPGSVADWPLGRRNRALAELQAACFGARLQGWTECLQCGDKLEFELDAASLASADMAEAVPEPITAKGLNFRLPTSRDLARIASEPDVETAALRLLERCMIDASDPGSLTTWTQDEIEEVGTRMGDADPLAEIRVSFLCPVCGGGSEEGLDLPVFLWAGIEGHAKRLLLEVHTLASTYGWSESAILALGDARRRCYLEMVQA